MGSLASFTFSVICTGEETSAVKFISLYVWYCWICACNSLTDPSWSDIKQLHFCSQRPPDRVLCRLSASSGMGDMWPEIMSIWEKMLPLENFGILLNWQSDFFSKLCLVQQTFYFSLWYFLLITRFTVGLKL